VIAVDGALRIQQHFDEHTYEYTDKHFDSYVELCRKENDFLRRHMHYRATDQLDVLDIGSGAGLWGDLLLAEYPEARVVCADFSWVMLHRNQRLPNKDLVITDATRLPFPESTFDLVSISALMHHLIDYSGYSATISNITNFLRSIKPILKPGGRIIVREIYHESLGRENTVSQILFYLSTMTVPGPFRALLRSVGVRSQGAGACFLTRRQWASVVAQSGYRLVEQEAQGWKVKPLRQLASIRHSGDLFLLLSPAEESAPAQAQPLPVGGTS
jgi:SAM-dependent methyltransferase